VDLRARAAFAEGAGGVYQLSAGTNGRTAAQIIFRNGPREVTADTFGLIDGHRVDRTFGRTITTGLENYAQMEGIRPGRNRLEFHLETIRGPAPKRFEILRDSSIKLTDAHPYEIEIEGPSAPIAATAGEEFSVPFRVTRRGGRPDVPVTMRFTGLGLESDGSAERSFRIGGGRSGEFRVQADRPGRYRGSIAADAYNAPKAAITVIVQPAVKRGGRRLNVPVVAGLGTAAALLVVGLRRRRRW
jgi:hypothetical protein